MLTSKQRSYLIGLSHELDPVVQIGKNGVSPETAVSTEEAFNTRELVKGALAGEHFDEYLRQTNFCSICKDNAFIQIAHIIFIICTFAAIKK